MKYLKDYVGKWLQFQSPWDLKADYVFSRLGDSLAHWQLLPDDAVSSADPSVRLGHLIPEARFHAS
jgi:hypothetical protein